MTRSHTESAYPLSEQMAFPVQGSELAGSLYAEKGLTKRELFAAMALQGLLANPARVGGSFSEVSEVAVRQADVLLEALSDEQNNTGEQA